MHEPATALTDFLMAAISFACVLGHLRHRPLFHGPLLFFLAFSLAAVFGGIWHGFFSASDGIEQRTIWWLSMLFGGLGAAGLALTGLELLRFRLRKSALTAVALFAVVFGTYAWIDPRFLATIAASAVGTLICVAGLLYRLKQQVTTGPIIALTALAISATGALAQQMGVALDPPSFDHNATYHLFLIVSLGTFHAGLRRISL